MLHVISLAAVLYGLWLGLSGHFEPLLLGLGVVSVVIAVVLAHRMDIVDHEGHPIQLSWRAVFFWPWLAWEIVKANIDVARLIVDPRLPISPRMIEVVAHQRSEVGLVTYANAITLTPGTVTTDVDGNRLQVHALTEAAAADLQSGEMDRRVVEMEGLI